MEHETREENGALVVTLSGDVDLSCSPEARKILLDCVKRKLKVVVDLSGITYIDSSGIASLVETLQMARKGGTAFSLAAVSEAALRVLQLARLDRVFTIHESVDQGLAGD